MKILGHAIRNQTPMIITFDQDEAEFICTHLAEAMEQAYRVYDFFTDRAEDYEDD